MSNNSTILGNVNVIIKIGFTDNRTGCGSSIMNLPSLDLGKPCLGQLTSKTMVCMGRQ